MRGTMAEEAEVHGGEPADDVVVSQVEAGGEEQGHEPESSRTPSDIEGLAQEMGWSPKEKWHGDPDQWKDAKTFLKSTVDVNRKLSKDVRELRETTERLVKTSGKLVEREVEKKVREASERFHQAVAEGDTQEAYRASEEIRQARQVEPQSDPAETWKRENTWFGTNDEASALAYGICQKYADEGYSTQAQLAEAEKAVRKAFPDLFGEVKPKSEQRAPPVVQGGQRATQAAPRKKGVNDLPPSVRSAAEKHFVSKGKCTLAEYAAIYWEEQA